MNQLWLRLLLVFFLAEDHRTKGEFHCENCVVSEFGIPLTCCVGSDNLLYPYICEYSGAATIHTISADIYPKNNYGEQFICLNPKCSINDKEQICKTGDDRKRCICNCDHNKAIVCQTEETYSGHAETSILTSAAFTFAACLCAHSNTTPLSSSSTSTRTTTILPTTSTANSTTKPLNSSTTSNITTKTTTTISTAAPKTNSIITSTPAHTTATTATKTTTTRKADKTTLATFTTLKSQTNSSEFQATGYTQHMPSSAVVFVEQLKSSTINKIVLIVLLFVAVVFIVAAVIVVLRKRKYSRENEESPSKKTKQHSEQASSEHVTVVPHKGSSDGTVPPSNTTYVEVEMTQRPTPSNNAIYASVQPTGEVVDLGKNVVYADLDLSQKVKQKPKTVGKTAVSLSPIYSTPYEPPTSDINIVYAEPFKLEKPTSTIEPVLSKNAVANQQNIYSLASQIPLHDPNVVYSECNKPRKSPTLTGKRVQDAGPISLEANQVKHPPAARGAGPLDQSAIYAEPCKMKMSP